MIGRLPFLQPIESKRRDRFVYSYDELVGALTDLATDQANNGVIFGRRLVLGDTIVMKAPITLSIAFLEIDGRGNKIVNNTGASMNPFIIANSNIRVERLLGAGTGTFGTFFTFSGGVSGVAIVDCNVACTNFVDGRNANSVASGRINGNITGDGHILINNATGCGIHDNVIGNGWINLGAGSGRCSIIGNRANGTSEIDTSASNGHNTIVGNTGIILTPSVGTDQLAANSA